MCWSSTARGPALRGGAGPRAVCRSDSAAAAGAAATLADIAGAGGTHLGAAGHADRCVGRDAAELLEQIGRAVHLTGDLAGRRCAGAGLHLGGLDLDLVVSLGLGRLLGDGSRLLKRLQLVLEVLVRVVGV